MSIRLTLISPTKVPATVAEIRERHPAVQGLFGEMAFWLAQDATPKNAKQLETLLEADVVPAENISMVNRAIAKTHISEAIKQAVHTISEAAKAAVKAIGVFSQTV